MLIAGCATTTQDKLSRVQNLSYAAASLGTQIALIQNPAYRPAFELAYSNLDMLVRTKEVTGAALRMVLASLPVKELKSDKARIMIEDATFLFDMTVGTKLNIEAQPFVLAAATGIRDGLRVGLGKPIPSP